MKSFILFIIALLLIACSDTIEPKKKLSATELKTWSKKLDFPQYCEEDAFEGDAQAPELKFYTLGKKHKFVTASCESFAYQNVVNLYRIVKEPQKPQVIDLLQIELNLHTLSYYDDNDNALEKPDFEVDFFRSAQIIHKSIQKVDDKTLEITRYYNQDGSCGSITRYDFSQTDPTIVSFQLQTDCEDGVKTEPKNWPFYKVVCQDSNNPKSCRLQKR